MATHTPTPWRADRGWVMKADGELIAHCGENFQASEDAAFIVGACNAHADLVAALRGCVDALNADYETTACINPQFFVDTLADARAALAKADA